MNEENIKKIFEEIDPKGEITQAMKEELIAQLKETYISKNEDKNLLDTAITEEILKEKLNMETDWKKKSIIAARIISLNL